MSLHKWQTGVPEEIHRNVGQGRKILKIRRRKYRVFGSQNK